MTRAAPSEPRRSSAAAAANHDVISRERVPARDARAKLLVDPLDLRGRLGPERLPAGDARDRSEGHRVGAHREPPAREQPAALAEAERARAEGAVVRAERDREDADPGAARHVGPLQRRQRAARLRTVRQQDDRAGDLPVLVAGDIADRRLHGLNGDAEPVADRRAALGHQQLDPFVHQRAVCRGWHEHVRAAREGDQAGAHLPGQPIDERGHRVGGGVRAASASRRRRASSPRRRRAARRSPGRTASRSSPAAGPARRTRTRARAGRGAAGPAPAAAACAARPRRADRGS